MKADISIPQVFAFGGIAMITFAATELQRYYEMLSHRSSASFNNPAVFDDRTYQILDTIFDHVTFQELLDLPPLLHSFIFRGIAHSITHRCGFYE